MIKMIGIIIVTHGRLGEELLNSAEMIVGENENIKAVSFERGESVENLNEKVKTVIGELSNCNDILTFVDIYGGSPFNTILPYVINSGYICLTGVNLPTIIEAIMNRNTVETVEELKEICINVYKESLYDVKEIYERRRGNGSSTA